MATGVADCVVAYLAFNERSGSRFGRVQRRRPRRTATSMGIDNSWGTTRWAWAPPPRRWRCSRGGTCSGLRRDGQGFGASRWPTAGAATQTPTPGPRAARSRSPITRRRAGSSSRCGCWTAARRPTAARAGRSPRWSGPATSGAGPAIIAAAAQGTGPDQIQMTGYYRTELRPARDGAGRRQLWEHRASADDVEAAMLYDRFTPFVLVQLEEFGFCRAGGGRGLRRRRRARPGRQAADQHPRRATRRGLHPRHERHRRRRPPAARDGGQPGARCRAVLVTAGTGVPTSGLILS